MADKSETNQGGLSLISMNYQDGDSSSSDSDNENEGTRAPQESLAVKPESKPRDSTYFPQLFSTLVNKIQMADVRTSEFMPEIQSQTIKNESMDKPVEVEAPPPAKFPTTNNVYLGELIIKEEQEDMVDPTEPLNPLMIEDDSEIKIEAELLPMSFTGVRIKQEPDSGTSDSETDSDSGSSTEVEWNDVESSGDEGGNKKSTKNWKRREPPRVKGEMLISELPPIQDLHITVPHEKCKVIGLVKSVVDTLVVVESLENIPALNLDTVLFLDEGDRALGEIFDVIGPVKQPHYCVRFNSLEHIDSKGIKPGMKVYCAPSTPYTNFVFVAQLMKMRGTDASWLDDVEPPDEHCLDYSDDEEERAAKKTLRKRLDQDYLTTEDSGLQSTDGTVQGVKTEPNSTNGDPGIWNARPKISGKRSNKRDFTPQSDSTQPQPYGYVAPHVPGFGPTHPYPSRGGRVIRGPRPRFDHNTMRPHSQPPPFFDGYSRPRTSTFPHSGPMPSGPGPLLRPRAPAPIRALFRGPSEFQRPPGFPNGHGPWENSGPRLGYPRSPLVMDNHFPPQATPPFNSDGQFTNPSLNGSHPSSSGSSPSPSTLPPPPRPRSPEPLPPGVE